MLANYDFGNKYNTTYIEHQNHIFGSIMKHFLTYEFSICFTVRRMIHLNSIFVGFCLTLQFYSNVYPRIPPKIKTYYKSTVLHDLSRHSSEIFDTFFLTVQVVVIKLHKNIAFIQKILHIIVAHFFVHKISSSSCLRNTAKYSDKSTFYELGR